MNTHLWLSSLTLGAALMVSPQSFAQANALRDNPTAVTVKASPSKPAAAVKTNKSKKPKSVKHLSKATLSAFKPLDQAQITPPAGAASAALSPMLLNQPGEGLREQPITVETSARSEVLNVTPVDQTLLVDEESAFVPDTAAHDQLADKPADSDVLGEESVSVIDRNTGKVKAKPLASGPLRVGVKDKGVRASVQIPIAGR